MEGIYEVYAVEVVLGVMIYTVYTEFYNDLFRQSNVDRADTQIAR